MLLERWARLQLAISISRTAREAAKLEHNVGRVDTVDSANLFKSTGWRALRKWFGMLSRGAKRNAIRWMTFQLEGVDKIKRAIEAQGDTFDPSVDLADIDFTIRTDKGVEVKPVSFGDSADDEHQHGVTDGNRTEPQGADDGEHPDDDGQAQA